MKTKIIIAVVCIAFFWGTTFLGIRIGVKTIPPFLLSGLRNLISGTLILGYLIGKGQLQKISLHQFFRAFILALLLIVLANGLTTYSEKFISSGLASLISTLSPLCIYLINLALGFEKLSFKTTVGILLALSGIFLIYQNSLQDLLNPEYRFGVYALLAAVLSWSVGTVIAKHNVSNPLPMLLTVALQMLIAGVVLCVWHVLLGTETNSSTWSTESIAALFYLAIFGSVVGYVAYSFLITQWHSTRVSVLSYVNVVVALFLGWAILDETITLKMSIATLLIISGVIIVNYKKR